MNMSLSSSSSIPTTIITSTIPLFINFLTIIIGTIGGIGNLITFTSPRLRQNSCVFYLLCASIFQLLSILFIVPTRMALDNFGNNFERQSIIFCKLRYYLSLTLPQLVSYYMLLGIVDRCLATSDHVQIRAWSQLKIAHRLSFALLMVGLVTTIHAIVFYDIYNNTCQVPPGNVYTIIFAVYLVVIVSLLPHFLMLIFALITFNNLKKTRRRIFPRTTTGIANLRTKRFESQLIMMIMIQVILSSILVLLRLGSYIYTTMTSGNWNKSHNERISETFALRLGIALYYFSFAINFYVSTLTSKYFREIFWKRMSHLYRSYC